MRNFLILTFLLLVSCKQLTKGQEQPVIEKNFKEKVFFTTCSGAVESWGHCNNKALRTCDKGYKEISKFESPVGGRRELTFQCK
jgi:hypothetical protein